MDVLNLLLLLLARWSTVLTSLALATSLAVLLPLLWRPSLPTNAPGLFAGGRPLLGAALDFYHRRATFTRRAHAHAQATSSSSSRSFSTYVGRYPVVHLGGSPGRAAIFGPSARDADLNLFAGYGLLKNGLPPIPSAGAIASPAEGHRLLGARMKHMGAHLPAQVSEVQARLRGVFLDNSNNNKSAPVQEWITKDRGGYEGVFDPREAMFRVAFAVNLRQHGASELMADEASLEWTQTQIETLRSGTSTVQIIVPLLSPVIMLRNVVAGLRLMRAVGRIRDERRRTGRREEDWMQQLIDEGQSDARILGAIIAALFASYFNVAMAINWIPLYLATNRRWRDLLRDEILDAVSRHRRAPEQTAWDVLATLGLEAWEADFPVLQLCLRETLRFTAQTSMYRKNTSGHDIIIGKTGEVIPRDAYVAYTLDEVHMNPEMYENPEKWDPARFQGEKGEGRESYTYVGWGGGRHICAGMRFAKLIIAIIIAHFVSAVDFEAVDEGGKVVTEQPGMSREGVAPVRKDVVRLRFRVRDSAISRAEAVSS